MNNSEEFMNSTVKHLLGKKTLTLTVEVNTEDEVNEILKWMYHPDKEKGLPELIDIAWDKHNSGPIDNAVNILIQAIRDDN